MSKKEPKRIVIDPEVLRACSWTEEGAVGPGPVQGWQDRVAVPKSMPAFSPRVGRRWFLDVAILAVPAPRPRSVGYSRGDRVTSRVYAPTTYSDWKRYLRELVRSMQPEGLMRRREGLEATGGSWFTLEVRAFFKTPGSWSILNKALAERGDIRPDSGARDNDNIEKSILDSLAGGLRLKEPPEWAVWRDDSQVVDTSCSKYYSAQPRTQLIITELPPE